MTPNVKHLGRRQWVDAALQAILDGGLRAVAVEPLARRLGVTKGSFYAHFKDRQDLVDATIDRWEELHITSFDALLERAEGREAKLAAVVALAVDAARTGSVEAHLLRAEQDDRIHDALARVARHRLARLQALLGSPAGADPSASHASTIAYALYLGLLAVARDAPERVCAPGLEREVLQILHALGDGGAPESSGR